MDKLHRRELKSDHFVEEVGHSVEYVAEHKQQFVRYGVIAVVVLLLAGGGYFYVSKQRAERAAALFKAMTIQEAQFGPPQQGFTPEYATKAARDLAAAKAFQEVVAKHGSSDEGMTAKYFLGVMAASDAKWSEAEKLLQEASGSGSDAVKSLAKFSLAQVYAAQNRVADAEKLLKDLAANPTAYVSKEQADIALGKLLMASKPAEAKKLLEPLRTSRPAVSRAAVTVLSGNAGN